MIALKPVLLDGKPIGEARTLPEAAAVARAHGCNVDPLRPSDALVAFAEGPKAFYLARKGN